MLLVCKSNFCCTPACSDDAYLAFFENSAEQLAGIKAVTEADQQDVFNTKNDQFIEDK